MTQNSVVQDLHWEYDQTSDQKHPYRLQGQGGTLAQIWFEHKSDRDAVIEVGQERFVTEKHLTIPFHLIIRQDGSNQEMARFEANLLGGGVLKLAKGTELKWAHHNIFVPEWDFENEQGQPIVGVKAEFTTKPQAQVTLGPASSPVEVHLLAAIGWYVILITNLYPSYLLNR